MWERQTKLGWRRLDSNPFRQVTQNAKRLNDFFNREGIVRWVERAVILAEAQPVSNFIGCEIPVWPLPILPDKIRTLSTRTLPTPDELGRINVALTRLVEQQAAREQE